MKKIILLLTCGLAFCTGTAQTLPKWANQAKKAVFSVITYNKDNKILNTGNGFYIDEEGTAVSDYSLFKGADHAVIVTADGKELPVRYIMGANDLYDVIKFKTGVNKKSATLDPAVQGGKTGEQIYLLPYSTQKSVEGQTGTITKVDTISNESLYYTLNMKKWQKYIDAIDLYLTVRNVACLTGYSGLNPEVNINGLDPGYEWFDLYPETRRYTFGVKLTF